VSSGHFSDDIEDPEEAAKEDYRESEKNLKELRAELAKTFDNPNGELTLIWLHDFCRQLRPTYGLGGSRDDMLYLEGRRSVILKILEHLQMDDVEIIERSRRLAQARLERSRL
jgi:hypothetical protein